MGEKLRDNEAEGRYELEVDGHVAMAEYDLEGDTIVFAHTEVPKELEGRGIAGRLVTYALDDVRKRGLKVVANCPFVARYIERHSEYADLLAG
jgi:predicted GNAT family acetyltransferase